MVSRIIAAASLFVATAAVAQTPYSRLDWPHWASNGLVDTRERVLFRDAINPKAVILNQHGNVIAGAWTDLYTGKLLTEPSKVDIDHLVPLKHAHDLGGWKWPVDKRREFANWMQFHGALVVTHESVNRSKGARPPQSWMPPDPYFHCEYVKRWALIKVIWGLPFEEQERIALRNGAATCWVTR